MISVTRYAVAAVLSILLAAPAMAETAAQSPSSKPSAAAPSTGTTNNAPAATPGTSGSTQPKSALVDINSASAEQLDALPGIGAARAKAIIANRPYKGKDDLAQRKIIPQSVYDGIKDKIVARQK